MMSGKLQLEEFFAMMFCPAGVSISRRVTGHLPLRDLSFDDVPFNKGTRDKEHKQ